MTSGVPSRPEAVLALVITGATFAAATVMVRVAVPVPVEFVADSVTVAVPAAVGVPLMAPVSALIDRPAGRPVAA